MLKRLHRVLLALGLEGVLGESGSESRRFYLTSSKKALKNAALVRNRAAAP